VAELARRAERVKRDTLFGAVSLAAGGHCGCRLLAKAPMRSPSALAHNLQTQPTARHHDATGGKENVPPTTRGEGWLA